MKSNLVPPAPLPSWETQAPRVPDNGDKSSASTSFTPLDAAFLSRTFVTIGWFGSLLAVFTYIATASIGAAFSFAAGAWMAALLLKSQEILVRRLLRSKSAPPYDGWDRKIPLWVLLPLKYVVVVGALGWGVSSHLLLPMYFCGGFGAAQVAMIAKVLGRFLNGRVRSVREVYIDPNLKHG